jgi:hypothetical protein
MCGLQAYEIARQIFRFNVISLCQPIYKQAGFVAANGLFGSLRQ